MLFRNTLFLSVLFTSAYAITIQPLLAARQLGGQCKALCSEIVNEVRSGECTRQCICTSTMINAIQTCLQCVKAAGETIPGIGPNYVQNIENDCAAAGYPVSGGGGGLTGGNSGSSDGLSGTGLGSGGATPTLGSPGGTATALSGGSTTPAGIGSGSGNGISFSSATGLAAQLGAVAAAVAGVVVLAA